MSIQIAHTLCNITLDSGSKITMPNVVRNVTRSTIIAQYLKYCEEEHFEPLSHRMLKRIVEVREESQRKLLQGIEPGISEDLEGLMIAYQNAPTRNLKLQILSLNAHQQMLKMLKKIHEPYGKITTWQIKMARQHARENRPGNIVSNLQIACTFMQYNFG